MTDSILTIITRFSDAISSRGVDPLPLLQLNLPPSDTLSDDELAAAATESCMALLALNLTNVPLPAGTPFQQRVWGALLSVPFAQTCSYSDLTARVGASPGSRRAVAQACGANRLALIVPCHRIVPTSGPPGGYRWGSRWKSALLRAETAIAGLSGVRDRDITLK